MLPFYRNLHGLTFPVGIVGREEVQQFLSHPADKPLLVPTLVLLDRKGMVSMKETGWIGEQKLRSAITALLSRKS